MEKFLKCFLNGKEQVHKGSGLLCGIIWLWGVMWAKILINKVKGAVPMVMYVREDKDQSSAVPVHVLHVHEILPV